MNENNFKTIYFIGIKGVGMSALAILAKEMGFEVSGSDTTENFITDEALKNAQINPLEFNSENLNFKPDMVVFSAAYDKNNIEIKEARKKHLNLVSYSEALNILTKNLKTIAVSGIHGKTTTAAMISFILEKANLDPSFLIGASLLWKSHLNGHFGHGEYFVTEADEYRKSAEDLNSKFFDLNPKIEVITSIEMDHPDIFSTEEEIYKAFYKFACRIPREGFVVINYDYPKAKKLVRSLVDRSFETYGFQDGVLWQIINYKESEAETSFEIKNNEKIFGPFNLSLPGQGNVLNATSAIIVSLKIGVDEKIIKKYLPQFIGPKRRFEIIGQKNNIIFVDDYAHHPRAVSMTLEGARKKYPGYDIWCIFQPHTYSRTKELLGDFAKAFNFADHVIITDIYSSAREKEKIITSLDLTNEIRKHQPNVKYISEWDKIAEEVLENVKEKKVIFTMGAGDIYKLGNILFNKTNE